MSDNKFAELAKIDVSKYVEKKNGLAYLSWAWAVAKLMEHDPGANWVFNDPVMFGDTMMVSCTVTAFGKPLTMHLPVMDHKNKAISNPDAFAVNKNMMRCLVKAIACHGLGLSLYAGEDLPIVDPERMDAKKVADFIAKISEAADMESLKAAYAAAKESAEEAGDDSAMKQFNRETSKRKSELEHKEAA